MSEFLHYIVYYGKNIIFLVIIIFLISKLFGNKIENYHSHWNTLLKTNYSTKEFYEKLKTELESHGVEGMTITYADLKEGGFRLYVFR